MAHPLGLSSLIRVALLTGLCALSGLADTALPRFEDYPAARRFVGMPVPPILATPEQQRYRSRIRDGVLLGGDTSYGSRKNPEKSKGPNFAGHYFALKWGCGSQCVMMAIVDATTGIVYGPPLSGVGSELYVPLDNLSDMAVDFHPDSTLLVLRNACQDFKNRATCGRYYFNWRNNQFVVVKFVAIDPLASHQ